MRIKQIDLKYVLNKRKKKETERIRKKQKNKWRKGRRRRDDYNEIHHKSVTFQVELYKKEFMDWLSSVQFSHSVVSDSLRPHKPQHARPPCPSPNSCPLSRWCHPTISSSVVPFSSCLQSFLASESFQMSQFFPSGGQKIGVSASTSVLPMNTQDWSPLGWTGWFSLQSKGLSTVFSNTTVQKHQFFSAQLSFYSNSHIHTWPLENP